MRTLLILAIALIFGAWSTYHLWRFVLLRLTWEPTSTRAKWNLPSLCCFMGPPGWVLWLFTRLSPPVTVPGAGVVLAAGICGGVVAMLIILVHEMQQPHPFR